MDVYLFIHIDVIVKVWFSISGLVIHKPIAISSIVLSRSVQLVDHAPGDGGFCVIRGCGDPWTDFDGASSPQQLGCTVELRI